MNKVKILFAAIAVIATVAGALAFKAQKFTQICVYTYAEDAELPDPTFCLKTDLSYNTTQSPVGGAQIVIPSAFTSTGSDCNPAKYATEAWCTQNTTVKAE